MTGQRRAAALAVLLWLGVAVTAAGGDASSFRVERSEIDVGTVVAGATATATFVFFNDGPEDVHIIRAKPS